MKSVLVYRSELLSISETFIRAQAAALREFQPRFIGLLPVSNGLTLPETPILLTHDDSFVSRARRAIYQLTRRAPAFHRAAKKTGAVLIHAHFAQDGVFALPIARELRIPLVVSLHGSDVTRKDEVHNTIGHRVYKAHREALWRDARLFICVSDFMRQAAIQRGFPANKCRVHYIGIDLQYFTAPVGPRERDLVLFVGRLVEKKGCSYLIDAMKSVQREFPYTRLVVIGDGPERGSLEMKANDAQIRCTFLGAQPSSEILVWLHRARVFSVPSVTAADGDSEGLGMVFAEAQATGLPVVSFRHGGIPEVVIHGETGLLAPERDSNTLAECICRFMEDDDYWEQCSRRAMRWAAERFDLRKQTDMLEEMYGELLE